MSSSAKEKVDKEEDYNEKLKLIFTPLLSYTLSRVFNKSDAFDVVQETMLILSQKREEFDLSKSFYAWSFRICHFQILKYLTDKKRNREDAFSYVAEDSLAASIDYIEAKCPFGIALSKELKKERDKTISNSLKILNPRQKEIITHSLNGKSNKEITEIMGLTTSQFSSAKTRAIKKIKWFLFNL